MEKIGPDIRNRSATIKNKITKAVDLFSRIKSTEQAEEVLTILFATRELKQSRGNEDVAEQDLYNYILDWKKSWRTDKKTCLSKCDTKSGTSGLATPKHQRLDFRSGLDRN
jgi:hypothetical protein